MRLIFLLVFLSGLPKLHAQTINSIPFLWSDADLNGVFFEKTAMHIPIQFEGDSMTYYFQFDTGANKSFLYIPDNPNKSLVEQSKNGDDIQSSIGDLQLIPITSNNSYTRDGKIFIGTIGADFLGKKIIEIDFPAQRINILESYDSSRYELKNSLGSRGRPTIQLTIEQQEYTFLYDTGSSLFDLWTTKKLWNRWKASNHQVHEFPISSWGKINSAYRTKLQAPIKIGGTSDVLVDEIWYNSNKKFRRSFKNAQVSGIIGNKPFLGQVVLIDVENQRIGLRK